VRQVSLGVQLSALSLQLGRLSMSRLIWSAL
jgi:hypothetical protein